MTNDASRAKAEGLPAITRRLFLRNTAAAGAVAATVAAPAVAEAARPMTPRERFGFHLAEMKRAAVEINPLIRFDSRREESSLDDPSSPLALMVIGSWATGRYDGDGIYAGSAPYGEHSRYRVARIADNERGERVFSVVAVGERNRNKWMRLPESRFESFIGRKVRGAEGGAA